MEENNGKIGNMQSMIKGLSIENDGLYHQLNHLMIRNNTLLKRIDDLQQAIHDLHIRLQESNLINNNLLKSNDHIRAGYDNRNTATSLLSSEMHKASQEENFGAIDTEELYQKWKSFPGQAAKNAPNLRKQVMMLVRLYTIGKLKASDLFYQSDIGAVTGARYVATLKKFGLIEYKGARKKGHYLITETGKEFIEGRTGSHEPITETPEDNTLYKGIPLQEELRVPTANLMDYFDL